MQDASEPSQMEMEPAEEVSAEYDEAEQPEGGGLLSRICRLGRSAREDHRRYWLTTPWETHSTSVLNQ